MAKKRRFIIDIDEETNEKKLIASDIILLVVFGLLIALVITLLVKLFEKKEDPRSQFADLVIPIIEKNKTSEISVDLASIKGKSYIIKIHNYKNKLLNSHEINYTIEINNKSKVAIEIFKNANKKDIAKSNNNLVIKNNKLAANKKQEDIYKIVVVDSKDLTSNDLIDIKIVS